MYKNVSLILVLVCLIGILSGCGNDQYAIERRFWYTQKQASNIFKNPHSTPPQELARVVEVLREFIKQNPKSELSIQQEFVIGQLYTVMEKFDVAREEFNKIIDRHKDNDNICAEAVFLIGNSYQLEEKWDLALVQFRKIMEKYPVTRKGENIPLYIAKYYEDKHYPEKMIDAYKEAIVYYDSLALKYPDSVFGYIVSNRKAQCYMALKDWQSAIGAFNDVVDKYKVKVIVDQPLLNIALIYKQQLKDASRAKLALERLIKEYPKSKFIKLATDIMEELGEGN